METLLGQMHLDVTQCRPSQHFHLGKKKSMLANLAPRGSLLVVSIQTKNQRLQRRQQQI